MSLTLIIAGMHRSGTSLTASFIKAMGVNLGENLLSASEDNVKGYFEDVDFVEFQRILLQNCSPPEEFGIPEIGWTESEYLHRHKLQQYITNAQELINSRRENYLLWGWKDPRTTLLLDFWDSLIPEAKYLFVYRLPWDVANSIQRVKTNLLGENPNYALKIWAYYNRHILHFFNRNSQRCILFNVNSWLTEPNKLIELLQNKLELKVTDYWDDNKFKQLYDETIFNCLNWDDHAIKFWCYNQPEYFALLSELDQAADIPSRILAKGITNNLSISQPAKANKIPEREFIKNKGNEQQMPIIVTGMHRSGTSLLASFIQAIGVKLGKRFFPSDYLNLKGYFEDLDFLEFQREVLKNSCRSQEVGWHDWGWTTSEFLDYSNFSEYIEPAKELIKSRKEQLGIWGWKDPRTTLMLDFWHQLLPEVKYIFVYRYPWDVLNSIVRPNSLVFAERPDYALKAWAFYNRHLLKFYQQHSEQSILVNISAIIEQPERLVKLLKTKLDLQIPDSDWEAKFKQIYDWRLFTSLPWQSSVVEHIYNKYSECFSLLAELEAAADLPDNFSLELAGLTAVKQTQIITKSTDELENETAELTQEENSEIAVSVVIPCYNQGEFILEAISSVESCQEAVYEIIIVNDGSTETLTKKVLQYLKDHGYFVIDQSNQGLARARNKGISKARGRYVLPLDSDNKIRPEYLTKSIEILDNHPEVGVVYSDVQLFDRRKDILPVPDFDINKLAMGNYIDACAVMRKQLWIDCGGYDDKIPDKLGYEDWDLWLGAAAKGWKFHHIPEVMFDYRVREDSMVSICRIPENHEKLVRYISTKHLDIYKSNFANILAEKDAALLRERLRSEDMEFRLQKAQVAWEEARQQLEEIQAVWQAAEAQVKQIQTAWEAAEAEVKKVQSCGEISQKELQQIQTAWEAAQKELRLTHSEWEKAESELQKIQTEWEKTQAAGKESQAQVQRIQTAWEEAQEQLRKTNAELQKSHSQTTQVHQQWEQAQLEIKNIYAEWEKSQSQLQQTHLAWEQAQEQIRLIHAAWEQSQAQTRLIYTEWEKVQLQLQQNQVQLQQIQGEWQQNQVQLQQMQGEWQQTQAELRNTQAELQEARAITSQSQSGIFGKIKKALQKLK
ncbi:glycosyltransferase [Aerosakkonemataceae cyanobacterium BLCC-F154]|uniref:Glycosyltransferase n=1 Tax=Floridaenema fluviatile BLCC-F154 TaxID=3153640 RepID=A0ABV4YDZ8_9CYAN